MLRSRNWSVRSAISVVMVIGAFGAACPALGAAGVLDVEFGSRPGYVHTAFTSDTAFGVGGGRVAVVTVTLDFSVQVFTIDGGLVTTFGTNGVVTTNLGGREVSRAAAIDSSGRVVVVGELGPSHAADFGIIRYTPTGALDTTFGGGDGIVSVAVGPGDDSARAVAIDASGRIVVGGYAQDGTGGYDFAAVRLTSTGALDTTFGLGDGIVTIPVGTGNDRAYGMFVTPSGKIWLAGEASGGVSLTDDWAVVLLTAAGVIDTSFSGDGKDLVDAGTTSDLGDGFSTDDHLYAVWGDDNDAVVTGTSDLVATQDLYVALFTGFNVYAFAPGCETPDFNGGCLPDYCSGGSNDGRPCATGCGTGTCVPSFLIDAPGSGVGLTGSPNGTITVVTSKGRVVRLDGTLENDLAFGNSDGLIDGFTEPVAGFSSSATGSIAIVTPAGRILAIAGQDLSAYTADGTPDDGFGLADGATGYRIINIAAGRDFANAVTVDTAGRVVAAGSRTSPSGDLSFVSVRLTDTGRFDAFGSNNDGIALIGINSANDDSASGIAIDSTGRIVVAGTSDQGASNQDFAVHALVTGGTSDTSFSGDGIATTNISGSSSIDHANAVAIDASHRVVVAGTSQTLGEDFAVVRYNTNGTLDTTFSSDGIVTTPIGSGNDSGNAMVIDANGKIVVAGHDSFDFAVVRYNANGSLDTTFSGDGIATTSLGAASDVALDVAIDASGRIVAVGYIGQLTTSRDIAMVRYNSNGSLDTTFGGGDGIVITDIFGNLDEAAGVALDASGRILVAGRTTRPSPLSQMGVVLRYLDNGTLDSTFDGDGIVTTALPGAIATRWISIALDAHQRIVVAGLYDKGASDTDFVIARFLGPDCGNGDLDAGEQCDDGNAVNGDCCTSTCQFEPLNSTCNDGNPCTTGDRCTGTGVCGFTSCNTGMTCNICGSTCKLQGFACKCG